MFLMEFFCKKNVYINLGYIKSKNLPLWILRAPAAPATTRSRHSCYYARSPLLLLRSLATPAATLSRHSCCHALSPLLLPRALATPAATRSSHSCCYVLWPLLLLRALATPTTQRSIAPTTTHSCHSYNVTLHHYDHALSPL
ncbi:Hypothetical protein NTJ_15231 [Nesidiocoris tenuis]|uniref:Uncharacterized protein n=1 Tax=Nesidiocoris tenuis TaxID=355587 RepID=A0ABN7BDK6_9HEMI|nr:Hypothetical protein NTJ_15231 [Nesidiocoris tenuis]